MPAPSPLSAAFNAARPSGFSISTTKSTPPVCEVRTPYSPALLDVLRSIPSARWNPDNKCWWFVWSGDPSLEAAQVACLLRLIQVGQTSAMRVDVDDITQARIADAQADHGVQVAPKTRLSLTLTQTPDVSLDPYQVDDLSQLLANGGRGLLAWDRGLGKTYAAIFFTENTAPNERAIGVLPEGMLLKFRRDWKKVNPDRPVYLYGIDQFGPRDWVASTNGVLLVGWASAYKLADKVGKDFPFVTLFADECHRAKNQNARRTKALRWLSLRCKYFMPMSGTPLIGRPASLWPILNMIDATKWGNFIRYARQYCDMKYNGFGYDFSGASNLSKLSAEIAPYVFRRLKSDVLKFLPAKSYETMIVPMDAEQAAEYQEVEDEIVDHWTSMATGNPMNTLTILPKMNALMQITAKAKMAATVAWIKDYIESTDRNEPLVVFTKHKWVADDLAAAIGDDTDDDNPVDQKAVQQPEDTVAVAVIHGDTPMAKRDKLIQEFQAGVYRVLFTTIDTGGESYEFTASSNMLVVELDWSPHKMDQMEDRIHRRGQTKPCTYTYVVCGSTIEERLASRLQQKNAVALAVLNPGAETQNMVGIIADELALAKAQLQGDTP